MWYSLSLMIALLCAQPQDVQTDVESPLNGFWTGVMSPEGKGYRQSYSLQLIISEKDGVVSGYSYISVDDIYAKTVIKGKLSNNLLFTAKDMSIEEDEVGVGMEWCIKNYVLILKKEDNVWKLEGHWNGKTSFSTCTPGKVFLKKIDERA